MLLTSSQVAQRGAPTFSAIVATGPFLKEHPDFVTQYADLVDGYFRSYASDAAAWSVESENVKLISNLQGGTPENVVEQLKSTIGVPTLEEQIVRQVARWRRQQRRRQNPERHRRLPQGSEEDHCGEGQLCRIRRSRNTPKRPRPFRTDLPPKASTRTRLTSHGRPCPLDTETTMLQIRDASVVFPASDGLTSTRWIGCRLTCPADSIVVALGASGCGKSTLLNAIAGFLPLTEGSITLDGNPDRRPGGDRGVVFQKDTLLPWAIGARQCRARPPVPRHPEARAARTCPRTSAPRRAWRISRTSRPMSFQAACASVSASRGRSPPIPKSC